MILVSPILSVFFIMRAFRSGPVKAWSGGATLAPLGRMLLKEGR